VIAQLIALKTGSVKVFISCAHRGFQLVIGNMLSLGTWVKANILVSEKKERARRIELVQFWTPQRGAADQLN